VSSASIMTTGNFTCENTKNRQKLIFAVFYRCVVADVNDDSEIDGEGLRLVAV